MPLCKLKLFLVAFILILNFRSPAQGGIKARTDSVRLLIKTGPDDSVKVNNLNFLSEYYQYVARFDTAEILAKEAVALSQKLNYVKGLCAAYNGLGNLFTKKGIYEKGMEFHFKSLRISEQVNDKKMLAACYSNIGILFRDMNDLSQALNYQTKGLKLREELDNKPALGASLTNIGNIYYQMNNFPKSLEYHKRALEVKKNLGNSRSLSITYNNIGSVYERMAETDSAILYYELALELKDALNDLKGMCLTNSNLVSCYLKRRDLKNAGLHARKAISIAQQLNTFEELHSAYSNASEFEKTSGNYKAAYDYMMLATRYKDSLVNESNTKKYVQIQMKYEFDKKTAADSIRNAEASKLAALNHRQEISRQKTFTYAGIAGFLVMIIVATISYMAFRNKKRANTEIARQKSLIEEKQKEILDSIHYARRIQKALITSEKYIQKNMRRLTVKNPL